MHLQGEKIMLKELLLTVALSTTFLVSSEISAQNIIPQPMSVTATNSSVQPDEYTRAITDNVNLAIARNNWQKIGSDDGFKISITTMNSLMTAQNGHQLAIVYYKLTSTNPYFVHAMRANGMPTFNYILDVHCFDLSNNSSVPLARIFIGNSFEQLSYSTHFDNSYLSPNFKIAKATHKFLTKAYNLE